MYTLRNIVCPEMMVSHSIGAISSRQMPTDDMLRVTHHLEEDVPEALAGRVPVLHALFQTSQKLTVVVEDHLHLSFAGSTVVSQ